MWRLANIAVALLLILASVASSAADDAKDVTATIRRFVHAFNRGDSSAMDATFADYASITDDFAPFVWDGPQAIDGWSSAFRARLQQRGMTGVHLVARDSSHLAISSSMAFAPVPVVYSYSRMHASAWQESGILVFGLEISQSGWKIVSMAWAPTNEPK